MVGVGALVEAARRPRVASGGKQRGEGEVSFCFTFLVLSHPLLLFPAENSGEAETAGTGDSPRPGPQPDLGRSSASSASSLRPPSRTRGGTSPLRRGGDTALGGGKAADEAAVLTFLTTPERLTAGSCLVSCWFCLFRFYAAALTPT